MLLPAAAAVCALAASQCCPLETPLKATKATTMLLPAAAAVDVRRALAEGAAARGGGPHTETPLKATKATKTMLLPAAATAGLRRPRRGRGGAGELIEVVDDEEAENKALESLRNAGPPDTSIAATTLPPPPPAAASAVAACRTAAAATAAAAAALAAVECSA
ncbi:hypothetical protein T492DRAFT_877340 [Pavlovales sp. CCMP2436]|nr:hypothetical protein T492DRAFT_877340 [Pavlovales sp. CCMP2436]